MARWILISYCFGCHCCCCRCYSWYLWLGLGWFFSHGLCTWRAHTQSWICGLNMNMFISSNQYYENTCGVCAAIRSIDMHKHSPGFGQNVIREILEQSVMASILMWISASVDEWVRIYGSVHVYCMVLVILAYPLRASTKTHGYMMEIR